MKHPIVLPLPGENGRTDAQSAVTVTGYTIDHSAYDAFMYRVETPEQTILHTGDFRGHGYRGEKIIPMINTYVRRSGNKDVDILITEGTMMNRGSEKSSQKLICRKKRQNISKKYLEQIISMLNKAGFVQSIRGAQGGYLLKKEPSEYTVGEILRLNGRRLSLVDCVGEENGSCRRKPECATARIWERISEAVNQVVDGITLADMVKWHLEMTSGQGAEGKISDRI